ncbi:hypothetical protein BDZ91DRAFT_399853 [Kalaharituber pfeilii]|nr:hypothetical protein BDZ91DRAFT_399853 [Kalaharituber pfeilii]
MPRHQNGTLGGQACLTLHSTAASTGQPAASPLRESCRVPSSSTGTVYQRPAPRRRRQLRTRGTLEQCQCSSQRWVESSKPRDSREASRERVHKLSSSHICSVRPSMI